MRIVVGNDHSPGSAEMVIGASDPSGVAPAHQVESFTPHAILI